MNEMDIQVFVIGEDDNEQGSDADSASEIESISVAQGIADKEDEESEDPNVTACEAAIENGDLIGLRASLARLGGSVSVYLAEPSNSERFSLFDAAMVEGQHDCLRLMEAQEYGENKMDVDGKLPAGFFSR